MGWFSGSKQVTAREDVMSFFVPADAVIDGNVESPVPCTVEGRITGNVSVTGSLIVAATAEISGYVSCGSITVFGKINRDIHCSSKAYIGSGGYVEGKITAASVELAPDATVNNHTIEPDENIIFDAVLRNVVTPPKATANEHTWF